MRALIVAHQERGDAAELAQQAASWCRAGNHEAYLTPADAEALGLGELGRADAAQGADVAISLGGDGTVLRTVELLAGQPTPVIGVNVGVLGYLAEVEPAHLVAALERFVAGEVEVDERMLLAVTLRSASGSEQRWRALNEAVLEKCESSHTVRLVVSIDGTEFTTYVADGLIVATPTGSTAYSLSARGPIVSPRHRALLVTPVSPHMLFDRTLVLDPTEDVVVELDGHRRAELSIDGQLVARMEPGDAVACSASGEVARFVRFGGPGFHQILKAKFGLSDR